MSFRVAVVGATGNVGREMLSILAERQFPVSKMHAVASTRSVGSEVSFGDKQVLKVESLDGFDFKGVDTKEEWKMAGETRKILGTDIAVTATCVRVPVFIGHAEAINVEFESPITDEKARNALKKAPGVIVIDHRADEGYITPAEVAGEDAVYVSRIRRDPTVPHGLNLWVVGDNLRKGAALNAVQIAEVLARDYLKSAAKQPARAL